VSLIYFGLSAVLYEAFLVGLSSTVFCFLLSSPLCIHASPRPQPLLCRHGGAESLLTVTNLLLVIGLRQAIREAEASKRDSASAAQSAEGDAAAGVAAAAVDAGDGKK
jgi:hypothetical protein